MTERQSDRQTGRQIDRQTDRQADRQTDRQAGRQTDRGTYSDGGADGLYQVSRRQGPMQG